MATVGAACGASDSTTTSEPAATTAAPAASGSTAAATTAAGPAIKVGLATDQGGLNDKGFNQLAFQGATKAKDELGITLEVKESKSEADYVPNLSYFCDNDFDVIIAIGFLMAPTVGQLAPKCTNSEFAIVDNSVQGDPINGAPNVTGLLFKEQETGYLVGYLAGLVVKNNIKVSGAKAVSSVGGLTIPPVTRFIAGYQKGAVDANPGLKTLNGYSQDFVDQSKCKELALAQIDQGSGVVFQVAGGCGLGALEAAGEKNVWGIGVDADQSAIGPQILTSAVKRVESAVFLAIKAAQDGTLKGGTDNTYGLAEDGVALGTVSPDVPQALVDEVNAKADEIKSGSIVVPAEIAG
ncbi:MAG: basic rane protein [Gaiellaceae bacterium]|nr:basic rane protein [Gaiellaceae bacterium]